MKIECRVNMSRSPLLAINAGVYPVIRLHVQGFTAGPYARTARPSYWCSDTNPVSMTIGVGEDMRTAET